MGYTWYRTTYTDPAYSLGTLWMCAIPNGSTYRRVRWFWGFGGDTADTTDYSAVRQNFLTMGMVTTIGDGSESVPQAIANSADADPPTQRWLWWESRQPVITAVDHAAGVVTWRDSGVQEVPDVKTQVLATGIPGGDTLNLWLSWQSNAGDWDPSGSVDIYVATAVLYSTP
jgi:hypothetical protein